MRGPRLDQNFVELSTWFGKAYGVVAMYLNDECCRGGCRSGALRSRNCKCDKALRWNGSVCKRRGRMRVLA
eukprot:2281982-Amphidinium_carterae.1